jgi:hypothetical protein
MRIHGSGIVSAAWGAFPPGVTVPVQRSTMHSMIVQLLTGAACELLHYSYTYSLGALWILSSDQQTILNNMGGKRHHGLAVVGTSVSSPRNSVQQTFRISEHRLYFGLALLPEGAARREAEDCTRPESGHGSERGGPEEQRRDRCS